MDFLGLQGRRIVVLGVANKKSVAWFVAKSLEGLAEKCSSTTEHQQPVTK